MKYLGAVLALMIVALPVGAFGATQSFTLDQDSQSELGLVIYNGFAMVRDVRDAVLPRGELQLEFKAVASSLKASSVSSKSLAEADGLDVLEQSYRYDLLNRESLLETYIGRKLKYSRTVLQDETYEKVLREGILLSTNPEIVDFGDEIEISPEGVISLPYVPEGLTLSPTLVWRVENKVRGPQSIETKYIAQNISWRADYVLQLNEKTKRLNLSSWATLRNDSGIAFTDAQIDVVAGEINSVPEPQVAMASMESRGVRALASDAKYAGPRANALGDYQMFSLPGTVTINHHEEKQVKFIAAENVEYQQRYQVTGNAMLGQQSGEVKLPVVSMIRFQNTKANQLGRPLAQGIVRAYRAEGGYLLGEVTMPGIAKGRTVDLALGNAFDIQAVRRQTEFKRLADRDYSASFELTLSNSKDESVTVQVNETVGANNWRVANTSQKVEKVLGNTARFTVEIPAGGEKTVSYDLLWSY